MPRRSDPSYDDSHRAFLQAFMARGTLTYDEAKPLLAAILSAHAGHAVDADQVTPDLFGEYISAVGRAVSDFDFEVRSALPQKTTTTAATTARSGSNDVDDSGGGRGGGSGGERVYALINATSDDLTQLATTFTADEMAFVKRVLDDMFDPGGGGTLRRELCGLHASRALQLHAPRDGRDAAAARRRAGAQGNTTLTQDLDDDDMQTQATQGGGGRSGRVQAITMTQAQNVLDNLVLQGWFERSRKGFYSLTPRALMELRTWLVDTYNEDEDEDDGDGDDGTGRRIKLCRACKEIVTIGQRCPKLTCPARLHDRCTQRFFRMQKSETCPVCKSDWNDHGFVGERATEPAQQKKKSKGPRASQIASRRISGHDGADDDDEEEDEDM